MTDSTEDDDYVDPVIWDLLMLLLARLQKPCDEEDDADDDEPFF